MEKGYQYLRSPNSMTIPISIPKFSKFNIKLNTIPQVSRIYAQFYSLTRELPGIALVNCAISHIFTIIWIKLLKWAFLFISVYMHAPYVWDHISEGKACIKNPKTCDPSKWPPLTTGMSYSCGQSVSIELKLNKAQTKDSHRGQR